MRIALAACIERVGTTGMGKWTERITNGLEARGHLVTGLFQRDFRPRQGPSSRHLFGVQLGAFLARNRRELDVAIIHEPYALTPAIIARIGGPPVVVMSHGVELRAMQTLQDRKVRDLSGIGPLRRWQHLALWGWREWLGFRLSAHSLCLSSADRDYLVKGVGLSPERVTLLVNGADPVERIVKGKPASAVMVLGSWIPEKGARAIPRIWRLVRGSRPDSRLLVAGTGRSEGEVLSDFAEADRSSVRVVPTFKDTAVRHAMFASSEVFLLPSLREGAPLALLEAMAYGLPAVASYVGGVPDILTDGQEGYLYPPFELGRAAALILSLLEDEKLRRRMGNDARARAKDLSWSRAVESIEATCAAVLGRG